MLSFFNKNKMLALFAFIGSFIPTSEAKADHELSGYEEIEEAIREVNDKWLIEHSVRQKTVETTTIVMTQTNDSAPVIEAVPKTNTAEIILWDVQENEITNQTVKVEGMSNGEFFDWMFSTQNEQKPGVTNAVPAVEAPVVTNTLDQVEAPVTNDLPVVPLPLYKLEGKIVEENLESILPDDVDEVEAPVTNAAPVVTPPIYKLEEKPVERNWKNVIVGIVGMIMAGVTGYMLGKYSRVDEGEQQPLPRKPVENEEVPLPKPQEKPQPKIAKVKKPKVALPSIPKLSMEELKKMGLVTASELRQELLTIDQVSRNELEKSFDENNTLPADMKARVLGNLHQEREGQANRLKAVRQLARIKAERKVLSEMMAKAKNQNDQGMIEEINSRRKALTAVKREVFEQVTGKYMGDIKEQRRLLAKEMTIARRHADQDKMIEIMKQRQLLNQQEKELQIFVAHINYERDRKGLMKAGTVDLIKAHHQADKREKRRLQDANRRAMKAIVTQAATQNKQLTR